MYGDVKYKINSGRSTHAYVVIPAPPSIMVDNGRYMSKPIWNKKQIAAVPNKKSAKGKSVRIISSGGIELKMNHLCLQYEKR